MNRRRSSAAVVLLALLLSGCAGGSKQPAPGTTRLPLQSSALAIGGDLQSRATDVTESRLTEAELKAIADACGKAVEIPTSEGDPCRRVMEGPHPDVMQCRPILDICLKKYAVANLDLKVAAVVEVVDPRPGSSQCKSAPGSLCLRLGVRKSEAADRIVTTRASTATTAPGTATATPTATATSTGTATPTSSGTSKPSPTPAPASSSS